MGNIYLNYIKMSFQNQGTWLEFSQRLRALKPEIYHLGGKEAQLKKKKISSY